MNREQRPQQATPQRRQVTAPTSQSASDTAAVEAALASAIRHLQAGEVQQAEALFRTVLKAQPSHHVALHLLGILALQAGRHDVAVDLICKAVAVKPDYVEAHSNLGSALMAQGKHEEAVDSYRTAIALAPNVAQVHNNLGSALISQGKLNEAIASFQQAAACEPKLADAHYNLGNALKKQGKLADAVASYRTAIALQPKFAAAHYNLGNVLKHQGKLEEAIAAYREAIAHKPNFAEAHNNLGGALRDQGEHEEAVASCQRVVALRPGFAEAHNNLGIALNEQGRHDEAVAAYRRAIALKPDYAEAYSNLGVALMNQGKIEDAIASCRQAIALKPDVAEAHCNLGNALRGQDQLDEAVSAYRRAIALKPDYAEAHTNLGIALASQVRLEEAVASDRQAIALNPNLATAHSNLLHHLHYLPGLTLDEIIAEHRRWNAQHAAPLTGEILPHTNVRDPDRRIRVGFVSGGFRRHPVGYMITPAVEARDGAAWELYVYSNGGRADDLTERIRAAADVWREIGGINDDAVARLARADKIDILVDLSGHMKGNRLLVFARKPAPVQVKWVGGQLNTTGMDAMDYFLSDAVETPQGAEQWFSEEVIRLPDGYACYEPPRYAPEVGPLPALNRGYTTFGCFNKLAKVNGEVVALWARLLHRLPGARLVLKTRSLGDPGVRERYHAMFEAQGVERERVDLLAQSPHAELLAHYNEIDMALDPFPYSGGLTTCEALWMGVPAVTLPGDTFAGRHSASHLHNVGLGDWVVETPEDYLAVAERWSRDVAALADLRAGLRKRMAASPLCDGVRFARNLEAAFRAMWQRWCEDSATPSLPRDRWLPRPAHEA